MIYLDTHIVVWLFAGQTEKLSHEAKDLLNDNEIHISPMVRLELQYLYEINRITVPASDVITDLSNSIGLKICDKNFNNVIHSAIGLEWTRDPFDRIIVAYASLNHDFLLTKDQTILENYRKAIC